MILGYELDIKQFADDALQGALFILGVGIGLGLVIAFAPILICAHVGYRRRLKNERGILPDIEEDLQTAETYADFRRRRMFHNTGRKAQ